MKYATRVLAFALVVGALATIGTLASGQVTPGNLPVFTDRHDFIVSHITSVMHVFGRTMLVSRDGSYATFTAGELNVNCTGCSAASVVEIDHVSSVTHVFGRAMLVGRDGTYVSVTGGELNVTCTGCSAASIVAVSHISAALHVAGTITGAAFHVQGLGVPGTSHGGVLTVQGITGMNPIVTSQSTVPWVIAHVSSVTHVVLAGTSAGSIPISTVAHVSSVTHVVLAGTGAPILVATLGHISGAVHLGGTVQGARLHIQGLGIPGQSHGGVLTVQGVTGMNALAASQSGTWTIQPGNTPNTTAWLVNVGHVSGAIHLASNVTDNANNALRVTGVTVFTVMGAIDHVATQVHVAGLGISPQFTMFRVNCGTTAATAVSVTTTRRRVILQNVGTFPIYIGGGHVTVTTSNAFTLHAVSAAQNAATTSRLELTDFQGRVDCISDGPGQTLEILQVIGGR